MRIGASPQAYLQLHSDTTTRAHTTTHPQSASGAHGKAGVFLRRGICRRCKGYQYSTSWSCISVDERVHTGDACGIGRGPSKCNRAQPPVHMHWCVLACIRAHAHACAPASVCAEPHQYFLLSHSPVSSQNSKKRSLLICTGQAG